MPSSDLRSASRGLTSAQILASLDSLTDGEAEAILYDWATWARDEQRMPAAPDWFVWLILAGRGWGKTRTGVEAVRDLEATGRYGRFALIGQTAADVRDVIVEGESGLLAIYPHGKKPTYEPSKRRITWPSGAIATTYSGDEPDQLRGPQHDAALCDELAKWKYAQDAWDNMEFGLRLGDRPVVVVTTTPRPTPIIRALVGDSMTVVTKGSTYDNITNLAPSFARRILKKYEGTRLGRQELHAEILDDNPGALWKRDDIEKSRVTKHPDLVRVVVGVDPQAVDNKDDEGGAETGIVVAGLGDDGQGYVLEDATVGGSPDTWGRAAVTAYHKLQADRVVAEVNNGGDMVIFVIETVDATVSTRKVHASRGKQTRAEPIAALYEQGRVHHVGQFAGLEDQMCQWQPGMKSPDRMDALVWALTELMLDTGAPASTDLDAPDLSAIFVTPSSAPADGFNPFLQ